MTGVVLKCPSCGTTQARSGECEACHEGDVRFFCTNHSPGRWLEQPSCSACGAVFGAPVPRKPRPSELPRPTTRPAARARVERPPAPRGRPRVGPWDSPETSVEYPPERPRPEIEADLATRRWLELLRNLARRRRVPAEPAPEYARPRFAFGSTFMGRLWLIALVLFFFYVVLPALGSGFLFR